MSESPKRRSVIFRTGKVDNIFKRFMKSKVEQKKAKENINAFLKESKSIKSYTDILIDEIKKPIYPILNFVGNIKRNIDVSSFLYLI